jgi:thymidylate synthase
MSEEIDPFVTYCEQCGCEDHPCMPCGEVVVMSGNRTDYGYLGLLKEILNNGKVKKNRTGIDTIGIFGEQLKFDVDLNNFPILTTKKVFMKAIVHELLWFIKGDTNIKYLVDNGVRIWDEWAYKRFITHARAEREKLVEDGALVDYREPTMEMFIQKIKDCPPYDRFNDNWEAARFAIEWGELGEGTYGGMWRAFPYYDNTQIDPQVGYVDQVQDVINKLKNNPYDRRIIVSAWHPHWVNHCALPPCHVMYHFNTEVLTTEERLDILKRDFPTLTPPDGNYTDEWMDHVGLPKRRLNSLLYQRSCDFFLGVPFNITSYCLLLAMVAHCVNMEPGVFTHTYGDAHIYSNHIEQVKTQLARTPKRLPKLWLNPCVRDLFKFTYDDIRLEGYNPHPAIKAEVAV